jgi:hypothetical protein
MTRLRSLPVVRFEVDRDAVGGIGRARMWFWQIFDGVLSDGQAVQGCGQAAMAFARD